MIDPLISSSDPVTLVGGGDATPQDLQKALMVAPICVAADGGAQVAVSAGVDIAAVIGDFDSVDDQTLAQIPVARHHHIAEQDSTDFEKALTRVAAPVLVGVGFLGARLDHQLAALHSLLRYRHRPCVLLGPNEVVCLAPPSLTLPTREKDVVSLFPLGPIRGRSSGLVWPIDGLDMQPGVQSGTSNQAKGPITLSFDAAGMILLLPRDLMPELVAALAQPQAARWPARAQ